MYKNTSSIKLLSFFVLFACIAYQNTCAQIQQIDGRVVDSRNGESLAFVNIGVWSKNQGTVSDEKGMFKLEIESAKSTDSICFSRMGYKRLFIPVVEALDKKTFELKWESISLPSVKIYPFEWRTVIKGFKHAKPYFQAGFDTNRLGAEVGVPVGVKRGPVKVKKAGFYISGNDYDSLFFRLNIYDLKEGKPGVNLLSREVFVETSVKSGWVYLDLQPYSVVADSDFLISLEWVKDLGEGGLYFACEMRPATVWFRETSQANWNKETIVGLGYIVEMDVPKRKLFCRKKTRP